MSCDHDIKSWTEIPCPVEDTTLTTYNGRLVLVGGIEKQMTTNGGRTVTNKLWSLQDDGTWAEELPPMIAKRYGAAVLSTVNHLIVAGGISPDDKKARRGVEVFDGKRWLGTESLPDDFLYHFPTSTLLNGEWYLKGEMQTSVFSARVDALIANAGEDEAGHVVWRKLLKVAPFTRSTLVAYGSCLLTLGGLKRSYGEVYTVPIHAHTSSSWLDVGDLPECFRSSGCIVLPSDELVVIGGEREHHLTYSTPVYKASLIVDSFQCGRLSIGAIQRLQDKANITVFQRIGAKWIQFADSLFMEVDKFESNLPQHVRCGHLAADCDAVNEERGKTLIKMWLARNSHKSATWMSLVEVLISVEGLASLGKKVYGLLAEGITGELDEVDGEVTSELTMSTLGKQLKIANQKSQQLEQDIQKMTAVIAEKDAVMEELQAQLAKGDTSAVATREPFLACCKLIKMQNKCWRRLLAMLADDQESSDEDEGTEYAPPAHLDSPTAPVYPKRGDNATLPLLTSFPGKDGKFSVPQKIGVNYKLFGIGILDDSNGDKVTSIAHQNQHNPQSITLDILTEWVQGRGIPDRTWGGLLNVLSQPGLSLIPLINDIEEVIGVEG